MSADARILVGDVRESLRGLPDGCVRTVVTSPPYWGLRDYGHDGQIGLEQTPDEYVAEMVGVFREVWRVLADDGTLWLNLGDSYAGAGTIGRNDTTPEALSRRAERYGTGRGSGSAVGASGNRPRVAGLKSKELVGIPWRVAFALQADGWYLRQDIIWAKPNPMPESVTDRCTKAHEYVFLLTKQPRYYYDHESVREPFAHPKLADEAKRRKANGELRTGPYESGAGRNDAGGYTGGVGYASQAEGRNKRSVWTVTTKPFKGAHFAVMPEALAEPCVLAGSSEAGQCQFCGSPWKRLMKITAPDGREATTIKGNKAYDKDGKPLMGDNMFDAGVRGSFNSGGKTLTRETIGWQQTCECPTHEPVPDTVLDPFSGSGTVGVVALRHGRNYIGCELNPEYAALSEARIRDDQPLLNSVEVSHDC